MGNTKTPNAKTQTAMAEANEIYERIRIKLYSGAVLMRQDRDGNVDWQLFNVAFLAQSEAEAVGLMIAKVKEECPNHFICMHAIAKIDDDSIRIVAKGEK